VLVDRGKQVLGLGIAVVGGQHLPGQRGGRRVVAMVDGSHRAIQHFIDRCTALARAHLLLLPQDGLRVPRVDTNIRANEISELGLCAGRTRLPSLG
jgi:hypothetical protein